MKLAEYLAKRSREICADNGCTEEEHRCESYAYIRHDGQLLDICASDYFCGCSEAVAAVPLPFYGSQEQLEEEVAEQCWEEQEEQAINQYKQATGEEAKQ